MIEKIVLDYLQENIDIPVYAERPDPKDEPDFFIVIDKTGSSRNEFLYTATIAVQSYGKTKYEAAVLNERIKNVMEDIIVLDDIISINLDTDYPFTDVQTKKYRYQAVFALGHY